MEIKDINLSQKGNTQSKQSKQNENLCLKLSRNVKHNWNVNQTKKDIVSEIFKISQGFHIVRDRFLTFRSFFY